MSHPTPPPPAQPVCAPSPEQIALWHDHAARHYGGFNPSTANEVLEKVHRDTAALIREQSAKLAALQEQYMARTTELSTLYYAERNKVLPLEDKLARVEALCDRWAESASGFNWCRIAHTDLAAALGRVAR